MRYHKADGINESKTFDSVFLCHYCTVHSPALALSLLLIFLPNTL